MKHCSQACSGAINKTAPSTSHFIYIITYISLCLPLHRCTNRLCSSYTASEPPLTATSATRNANWRESYYFNYFVSLANLTKKVPE